jgi:hypothetical protein
VDRHRRPVVFDGAECRQSEKRGVYVVGHGECAGSQLRGVLFRHYQHELLAMKRVRKKVARRRRNPKRQMPPALKRYWQARNRRLRNPQRARKKRVRRRNPIATQHVLLAQRPGGPVLKYLGGIKFSQTGHAVRFANKPAARAIARSLRASYPVLRPYRVWVT